MSPRMTADERRRQVVAIAAAEFAHGGLNGTSTDDIAKAAGISQPYLFRLFPTKKDLFIAAIELSFERARRTVIEAAGDLTGEEAMEAMGRQYRLFLEDRTLLLTQMHAYAACDDTDVRQATREAFGKLWSSIAEITGAGEEEMVKFVAHGMLLNVAASMRLTDSMDIAWVKACLGP